MDQNIKSPTPWQQESCKTCGGQLFGSLETETGRLPVQTDHGEL